MPLPYFFANATNPTTPQLDANFNALGALVPVVCTASGSNAIALTIASNNPTVSALANYMPFTFIAAAANTGAVTIAVGGLAALPAYIDRVTGPGVLTGGEIQTSNLVMAIYDTALNGGGGGFHLFTRAVALPASAAAATVSATSGATLTAAQLTGAGSQQGIILRSGPTAGFSDTTDTATAIVAAIPYAGVGTLFRFRVQNSSSVTQTISGGTGVTVTGPATTATGVTHDFIGMISAVGTPAVTIYG